MSISLANLSHSIHSIRSPVTEMYGGVRRALRNMVEKSTQGYEVYVERCQIWSKRLLRGTRCTERIVRPHCLRSKGHYAA